MAVVIKDESLDEQINDIRQAFRVQFPIPRPVTETDTSIWVADVFDDFIVVNKGEKYYRVSYSQSDEDTTFADVDEWVEVEEKREWIEKIKSLISQYERTKNGNALKVLSQTDEELRVANYIILYGGKDFDGEHFTKSTSFDSPYTQTGRPYVDWEHGLEKKRDKAAPGEDDVLGYVDWGTAKSDDLGLWVERVLNRRNKYMEYIEPLIKNDMIGNSSEAIPDKVKKTQAGEIVVWPIYRDTLTVNPTEPRMMTDNVIAAIKSLAAINPDLEALLPQEPGDGSSAGATVGDENGADNRRAIQRKAIQFLARL